MSFAAIWSCARLHGVLYHYLVDSRLYGILYFYLVDFQASQYLVEGLSYFPVGFRSSQLVFMTCHYLVDSRLHGVLEKSRYYSVESGLHNLNWNINLIIDLTEPEKFVRI